MDNLFKALLIIILLAFLYLYYENSDNDRYFYIKPVNAPLAKFGIGKVFDKKTGTLYIKDNTGFISVDYINGTQKKIEKSNK